MKPHQESSRDQDIHKGAVEGDRPNDKQNSNQQGSGVDKNGMPNAPVKTAQDRIGANEDESQG
jgi:hypothetical protein